MINFLTENAGIIFSIVFIVATIFLSYKYGSVKTKEKVETFLSSIFEKVLNKSMENIDKKVDELLEKSGNNKENKDTEDNAKL